MPWTAKEFTGFKKDLTEAEARRGAEQANAILESCLAQGGKRADCERLAIATALKNINDERKKREKAMAKYTEAKWDFSMADYTVEQLLDAVPRAIAAWARKKAESNPSGEIRKSDLALPYKTPDGTINMNAVRNALARLPQVKGIPRDVLADARRELQGVLEEYKASQGRAGSKYIHALGRVLGQRLENGILKVTMALTAPKVYSYEEENGTVSKELLPEEEVLSENFLKQCVGLPITLDHPYPGRMVTPENIEKVIVGLTGENVRIEDKRPIVDGYIWREDAIKAIQSGNDEVSIGYIAEVTPEEGEYNGERYMARQRVLQLNHVAVGLAPGEGRCGRECVIMNKENSIGMGSYLPGSYEDKKDRLEKALRAKYTEYSGEEFFPIRICAVFDDRVVYEDIKTGKYYEAPYTENGDGSISIGGAREGHLEFVAMGRHALEVASGKEPVGAVPTGSNKGEVKMELNVQGVKLALKENAANPEEVKAFQAAIDKLSNEHADLVARARKQEALNSKLEAKEIIIQSLEQKCKAFEERVHALESGKMLDELVGQKLELIRTAEERINGYQFAGKSNREIMVDIIKSISPSFDEKGKSDETIREIYHALLEHEKSLGGVSALKSVKATGEAKKRDVAAELEEWREKIKGRSAVKK